MTTIPTLLDGVPVDAVRARAVANPVDWRRVALAVLAVVPLMMGRAVGLIAWGASYAVAAFMEGYEAGRVPAPAPETPHRRPRSAVVPTRTE